VTVGVLELTGIACITAQIHGLGVGVLRLFLQRRTLEQNQVST